MLPINIYNILKYYLTNRHFLLKYKDEITSLHSISSGVPQGSVLGPLLYLIYTADLPVTADTEIATFADDTAILTTHVDPVMATHKLQTALYEIQNWLKKWRMKANETKSTHLTFTLKKTTCPSL